jgi:hypothetical protein
MAERSHDRAQRGERGVCRRRDLTGSVRGRGGRLLSGVPLKNELAAVRIGPLALRSGRDGRADKQYGRGRYQCIADVFLRIHAGLVRGDRGELDDVTPRDVRGLVFDTSAVMRFLRFGLDIDDQTHR